MLGVGSYTYIASWVMMPVYLLITWVVVWQAGYGIAAHRIVLSAIAFAPSR